MAPRGPAMRPAVFIGGIGGVEWFGSCVVGLWPGAVNDRHIWWGARNAIRADPEADNMEYHPRPPPDLPADAGGALKSALELRLQQREEGRPVRQGRAGF